MVTGCTSGIGLALAKELAPLKPACFFVACRSKASGEKLSEELIALGAICMLRRRTGARCSHLLLTLSTSRS